MRPARPPCCSWATASSGRPRFPPRHHNNDDDSRSISRYRRCHYDDADGDGGADVDVKSRRADQMVLRYYCRFHSPRPRQFPCHCDLVSTLTAGKSVASALMTVRWSRWLLTM